MTAPRFHADLGLVDRSVHSDPAVFQEEMQKIFGRAWLLVGHESQIPRINDFFASRMGRDRVVVTRVSEREVCVLLNSCRHKGMRVVRCDAGNSKSFACPYHAWTYAADGRLLSRPGALVGVQRYKEAYEAGLDRDEWGLVRARTDTYKGAIFATWAQDGPPLLEYLDGVRPFLDVLLDAQDGGDAGVEFVGGVYRWRIKANWKVCSENFIGDPLHVVSHQSVEAVGIGPTGDPKASRHGITDYDSFFKKRHTDFAMPRWGHGASGTLPHELDSKEAADIFPQFVAAVGPADNAEVAQQHYRAAADKRLERRRGTMDVASPFMVGGVFPNMSFHAVFPRTVAVWHPLGPSETEGWRWAVVDRNAPAEVKAAVRHHLMRYAGPVGMTEQDDMENWSYLTESTRGDVGLKYPFNYQARLGAEQAIDALAGVTTTLSSATEGNQRGFYAAWRRHLASADWEEYLEKADQDEASSKLQLRKGPLERTES